MSQSRTNDTLELQHSASMNDMELHNHDQEESGANMSRNRQSETTRIKALVLLGSSIIQLPVWGFAMSYGVIQEFYSGNWTFKGSQDITGIIGTTFNGVMYLSMPLLFALFTKRWAQHRQKAALCGAALTGVSFCLSSFSSHVWQLVCTQGILSALGCALMFSPTTLSLGECFNTSNRALAYGVTLSSKNIVGSVCPFLFRACLDKYGFRTTSLIWTAIAAGTSIPAIIMIPTHPSRLVANRQRARRVPWSFLRHRTIWIYSIAILLQSCGYGIPQTYLNTYAHEVTLLSQTSATLLLTLCNIPGIISSSFFGYLSDNKQYKLSATTVTAVSATSSALSVLLFWGLTTKGSFGLLVVFSITFGFFAGGYSGTWGGVINELEQEAASKNEAIDSGMVYGLLNGARGVGYVTGGLASVPLLKLGTAGMSRFGYGTEYGPLIIFTGLSTVFGGWGLLWKLKRLKSLFK